MQQISSVSSPSFHRFLHRQRYCYGSVITEQSHSPLRYNKLFKRYNILSDNMIKSKIKVRIDVTDGRG